MDGYFVWIIITLLLANSLRILLRDIKKAKRAFCTFCKSTNVSENHFRKYGACRVCGHKWKLFKFGGDRDTEI